MTETVPLADHLNGRTDAILAVWRTTVDRVGDVPESEKLSYHEFIDHIPQLLGRLGERLRGGHSPATPEGKKHGTENPEGQHAGDLPNVTSVGETGQVLVDITTDLITLGEGTNNILDADGSAIVLHEKADDYKTDPTGEAGGQHEPERRRRRAGDLIRSWQSTGAGRSPQP